MWSQIYAGEMICTFLLCMNIIAHLFLLPLSLSLS